MNCTFLVSTLFDDAGLCISTSITTLAGVDADTDSAFLWRYNMMLTTTKAMMITTSGTDDRGDVVVSALAAAAAARGGWARCAGGAGGGHINCVVVVP